MNRFPEPELMNDYSQVKAYAEADFFASDQAMVDSFKSFVTKAREKLDHDSLIIDLGCGPGNISEKLAFLWPNLDVIGIDGSENMIAFAKSKRIFLDQKKKSKKKLSYLTLDISEIPTRSGLFKKPIFAIVSNSVLHHLRDPMVFWKALKKLSKPGVALFHKDLRRPESREHLIKLQQKYLCNAPKVLERDFIASLKAAFTLEEVALQLKEAGLDHLNVKEVDDRYIEVKGFV